jgi:hypothetical protein
VAATCTPHEVRRLHRKAQVKRVLTTLYMASPEGWATSWPSVAVAVRAAAERCVMDTSKDVQTKSGQDRRPSGSQSIVQSDTNETSRTDATRPEVPRADDQPREASRRDASGPVAPRSEPHEADGRSANRLGVSENDEQWKQIMIAFVDDPRAAVTMAHELVGQAIQRVADDLNAQLSVVQQQWSRAGAADTESLRTCLQQYRAFFHRLEPGAPPGASRD